MFILGFFVIWWAIVFIKPIKIKVNFIPEKFAACAIAPIIFYKDEMTDRIYKHEFEHVRQQRFISPFLFYLLYLAEYLTNLSQNMNYFDAYYNISFEVEARKAEDS